MEEEGRLSKALGRLQGEAEHAAEEKQASVVRDKMERLKVALQSEGSDTCPNVVV